MKLIPKFDSMHPGTRPFENMKYPSITCSTFTRFMEHRRLGVDYVEDCEDDGFNPPNGCGLESCASGYEEVPACFSLDAFEIRLSTSHKER